MLVCVVPDVDEQQNHEHILEPREEPFPVRHWFFRRQLVAAKPYEPVTRLCFAQPAPRIRAQAGNYGVNLSLIERGQCLRYDDDAHRGLQCFVQGHGQLRNPTNRWRRMVSENLSLVAGPSQRTTPSAPKKARLQNNQENHEHALETE